MANCAAEYGAANLATHKIEAKAASGFRSVRHGQQSNGLHSIVEFRTEGAEVIARCPELRLTDHSATEQEAVSRLRAAVVAFIEICARKGTLFRVLDERGLLKLDH